MINLCFFSCSLTYSIRGRNVTAKGTTMLKIKNLQPFPTTTTTKKTTTIDEEIQEKEVAPLSVVKASSVYLNDFEKWGPEQALT